jgi:signal peptidase II
LPCGARSTLRRAMTEETSRRRSLVEGAVLAGVAGIIYLADQLTKALVIANLPVDSRTDVVGDLVQIWHAQNRGAAFSLLQNSQLLFLAVSALALVTIAYFYRSLHGRSLWLYAILGLVLGGTLGNLTDRVRQQYVTDFVSVGIGNLRWPTFNVADSSIVVGILAIITLLAIFERSEDQQGADPRIERAATTAEPSQRPESGGGGAAG